MAVWSRRRPLIGCAFRGRPTARQTVAGRGWLLTAPGGRSAAGRPGNGRRVSWGDGGRGLVMFRSQIDTVTNIYQGLKFKYEEAVKP